MIGQRNLLSAAEGMSTADKRNCTLNMNACSAPYNYEKNVKSNKKFNSSQKSWKTKHYGPELEPIHFPIMSVKNYCSKGYTGVLLIIILIIFNLKMQNIFFILS